MACPSVPEARCWRIWCHRPVLGRVRTMHTLRPSFSSVLSSSLLLLSFVGGSFLPATNRMSVLQFSMIFPVRNETYSDGNGR